MFPSWRKCLNAVLKSPFTLLISVPGASLGRDFGPIGTAAEHAAAGSVLNHSLESSTFAVFSGCWWRYWHAPAESGSSGIQLKQVPAGTAACLCSKGRVQELVPRYSGTWCWLGTALLFRKLTCRVFRPIVVEAQTHFSRTHDSQIVSNSTCSGRTSLSLQVNVC